MGMLTTARVFERKSARTPLNNAGNFANFAGTFNESYARCLIHE